MAQSTFRRRGTGSCPPGVERPDGSPVDGVHPHTTAGRRVDASNGDRDNLDGAPADLRVDTVRQRRLAQSLIYAGGAAFVIAGCGLLLVGARRRLW